MEIERRLIIAMAKKQFKTESRRILDMMINSVYTNKEIFLRELISNASDAIDKLSYKALTDDSIKISREEHKITLTADKDARTLTISDTGIGMTRSELDENLGVIANSGSFGFKNEHKDDDAGADIIGQFGVGFYSCFMVSSKVTVITKAYGSDEAFKWTSEGLDGYTVTACEKDGFGTDIILTLKPDEEGEDYSRFLDNGCLKGLVKRYSDFIRWPIIIDGVTVNSRIPIWQRSKSEVSDSDCAAFYRETFRDMSDPAGIIRANAEGQVSFKAMLFIPSSIPFDYYTAAYTPGLRLYSNGVMIMENCADLLPDCFRFVRGIVDSPDLSLNISREILQQDRQLKIISQNLEKRVKNELSRLLENQRDKYESFYKSFGLQLKYGVVADYGAKKDELLPLLLFYSDRQQKFVTFKEYADSMPEDQKYIYFACGETAGIASGLPQTEIVRDSGYDILCATDSVDEFVMGIIGSYGDKEIKNVNSDDLGLESEEKKTETEQEEKEQSELLSFIREALGDRVSSVKLSGRLKSHPACLSSEGMITLEMEKYFASLPSENGEKVKAQRVLEINPDHPVFSALKRAFAENRDRAADISKLLYDISLLIAGYMPENPSETALLMSKFID